jgi:hypothetical protein
MITNAGSDGFMVHPLDLFPSNKNVNTDFNNITQKSASLDGFQVHPIDLFVSHDNTYPNNVTNNLTQNYGIINTPQNTNINIAPYTQTTAVGNVFNNPRIIQGYESQINPNSYYITEIPNNVETNQNTNISYVPIPQNLLSNFGIYSNQTIHNMINQNYTQQNPTLDNTYTIVNLPATSIIEQQQNTDGLINYGPSNTIINQTGPYNQDYNLVQTENIYQNYPQTNNIQYITPQTQAEAFNTTVNYFPNQISNINYASPQIQPYPKTNITPNINIPNNFVPLNSNQMVQNNSNVNMNLNPSLILPGAAPNNKGLPYSLASYEPDTNSSDYQAKATIGGFTTSEYPLPNNTLTRADNIPTTIIVPTKKSIIIPTKKTIIIPKKTTVIVPNIRKIVVNTQSNSTILPPQPYIEPVVTSNAINMERTNLLLPTTNTILTPLQSNYSSHTISGLPRSTSLTAYNPRSLASKNNFMTNLQNKRPVSTTTSRYNNYTYYNNSRNNRNGIKNSLNFRNNIYKPRNY